MASPSQSRTVDPGRSPDPPKRPLGGIRAGSVAGIPITLDYSWFVIFFLVLGTFAGAVFPAHAPDLGRTTHLLMGLAGAILFWVSLLLHELAHAFAARARGVGVEGITLFIFGGMARTTREATRPADEFFIAVVGPLASLALAVVGYGIGIGGPGLGIPESVTVVAEYLGFLNLLLAVFNLFPGFPLDGGRILRAGLWQVTGSLRRATRLAALSGRFLGWAIIGLGIWSLLVGGGVIGGLWLIFIGWFLTHAARSSYQQLLLQQLFNPLVASDAMSPDPETVSPDLPLPELVLEHFLRRPYNSFPVTEDGVIVGLVTLGHVKRLERKDWAGKVTGDVMTPLRDLALVAPETPMAEVLEIMREDGSRRVLVAREWELLGILSTSDIARWLERVTLVEETQDA
ncbi:MAG: site-2 protease family protein [Gemmatimonadales bacterium]|nr:MAG: site-2 protease family protein [Gemmatimonadales bacterium]